MGKEIAEITAKSALSGTMKARGTAKAPSENEIRIYEMSESGVPYSEISAIESISIADIKASVRRVEKFIESGVAVDVAAIKAQQHIRIEGLRKCAMQGFVTTAGPATTTRRKFDSKGNVVEETVITKEQAGDPRYLSIALKCMEAQRDLWPGASAPKATALTNADGSDNPRVTVETLASKSIEELQLLEQAANILDAQFVESKVQPDHPQDPSDESQP